MSSDASGNRAGGMDGSGPQSYPSPNAAQTASGSAPYWSSHPQSTAADSAQAQGQMNRENPPTVNDEHIQRLLDAQRASDPDLRQHSPQQMAQLAQAGVDLNHDPSLMGDLNTPRKRVKVSRACDECRRKKIRCDASADTQEEKCSNCRRVGCPCQFSRVPLKRGPSKGYIKELADRINTLESSMGGHPLSYQEAAPYAQMTTEDSASPRNYDPAFMSGYQQRPPPGPPGVWSAQETPRHLPHPASLQPQTPQSIGSLSENNQYQQSYRAHASPGTTPAYWNRAGVPDSGRRTSVHMPLESSDGPVEALLDWDESTIDEYYTIIHPTFPLLPNSKERLRSRLANCPGTLQDAFLGALYAAVRSFPSSKLSGNPDIQKTKKAAELLLASQFENPATRTMSTNLIFMQALIFMCLEADNHGPATMRGQLGAPRSVWLGCAIGLSYYLKMHVNRYSEKFGDGDLDSDEKLARRIWWVLVILDRWNASSTSSPLLIPDESVLLIPQDQVLLGDSVFHLARLSCIVGHLASIFVASADVMAPSSPSAPLIGKLIRGEIERFRESIDSVIGQLNLVHLSYWHVRLLMQRHISTTEPNELLGPAERMATILDSPTTPITPLNHHFAALATLTLVELADIPETKDGAWRGIDRIHEALDKHRGLSGSDHSFGWDSAIRDLITKKKQQLQNGGSGPTQGSLQHLADLAVGATGEATPQGSEKKASFDPTLLTRCGYLTVLVQDDAAR